MDSQKIVLELLKDISDGKVEPRFTDYNIDIKEFGDIVDMVQNEGLIMGAKVVRGGQDNPALIVFLNTAKITIKGLKYIEDNTTVDYVDEKNYSDEELENELIQIIFSERGSKKRLTVGRIRKLLPTRLNYSKIEWLLNNLIDKDYIRTRRLSSYKDINGKMQTGEVVYEITPKGVDIKDSYNILMGNLDSNSKGEVNTLIDTKKVFIIHGHDNEMKSQVQLFLSRADLDDVVLHECADKGRTIIDKLIEESKDAGYVIALLSPDDELLDGHYRARQNVILEIGYFLGKLGKSRVRILRKGSVEIPSDLHGILYQEFDEHGSWKVKLLKEMEAVGISIDLGKALAKL